MSTTNTPSNDLTDEAAAGAWWDPNHGIERAIALSGVRAVADIALRAAGRGKCVTVRCESEATASVYRELCEGAGIEVEISPDPAALIVNGRTYLL